MGTAFGDALVFAVPELRSGREIFSPHAAFDINPVGPNEESAVDGPPLFAVELRDGPDAEKWLAEKGVEYFEAGTRMVCDVNPRDRVVTKFAADGTEAAFASGERADAEPVLPGWSRAVDDIFELRRPRL